MRLSDIGLVRQQLSNSPVFADPIWDADAGVVTSFQLTLFQGRMTSLGLAREANEAVDVLVTEARAANNGQLRFLDHRVVPPRFMADELIRGLRAMTPTRAQACLLALEEGRDPEWALSLTWKSVLAMTPNSGLSVEILRTRNSCRHIRLHYVFWEFASPTIAAPLLRLEQSVRSAFRMPWADLREAYSHLVMIDRRADAQDFALFLSSGGS